MYTFTTTGYETIVAESGDVHHHKIQLVSVPSRNLLITDSDTLAIVTLRAQDKNHQRSTFRSASNYDTYYSEGTHRQHRLLSRWSLSHLLKARSGNQNLLQTLRFSDTHLEYDLQGRNYADIARRSGADPIATTLQGLIDTYQRL